MSLPRIFFVLIALIPAGCSKAEPVCGPGTKLLDGQCIVEPKRATPPQVTLEDEPLARLEALASDAIKQMASDPSDEPIKAVEDMCSARDGVADLPPKLANLVAVCEALPAYQSRSDELGSPLDAANAVIKFQAAFADFATAFQGTAFQWPTSASAGGTQGDGQCAAQHEAYLRCKQACIAAECPSGTLQVVCDVSYPRCMDRQNCPSDCE